LTQGSQSLALGLTLTTAPQLVEVTPEVSPRNPQSATVRLRLLIAIYDVNFLWV